MSSQKILLLSVRVCVCFFAHCQCARDNVLAASGDDPGARVIQVRSNLFFSTAMCVISPVDVVERVELAMSSVHYDEHTQV